MALLEVPGILCEVTGIFVLEKYWPVMSYKTRAPLCLRLVSVLCSVLGSRAGDLVSAFLRVRLCLLSHGKSQLLKQWKRQCQHCRRKRLKYGLQTSLLFAVVNSDPGLPENMVSWMVNLPALFDLLRHTALFAILILHPPLSPTVCLLLLVFLSFINVYDILHWLHSFFSW